MAISQKLLNPGESVVISTRTHPKALLLPLLALVVILAVGVAFMQFVDNDTARLVVWVLVGPRRSSGSSSGRSWCGSPRRTRITNRRLITRRA